MNPLTPDPMQCRDLRQVPFESLGVFDGADSIHLTVGATSPSTLPFEFLRAMSQIEWLRTLSLSKGRSRWYRKQELAPTEDKKGLGGV